MSSIERSVQVTQVRGRYLLLAFVWALAVMIAVHVLDFPGSVQEFKTVTHGQQLLDTTPAFDTEAVSARIHGYGEAGRANYRFRLVTVDVFLPLSLTPFLFLLMLRGVDRVELTGVTRRLLLWATLAYLLFDLAENATLFVLLSSHPSRNTVLETVLPYLTAFKRAGILTGLVIPAVLLAFAPLKDRLQRIE